MDIFQLVGWQVRLQKFAMCTPLVRRWQEKYGQVVSDATMCPGDLVRIIGEFAVPPSHSWMPAACDNSNGECTVPSCLDPIGSSVFHSCARWSYIYKHACSRYTMEECESSEFTVHIDGDTEWWVGLLWDDDKITKYSPFPIIWAQPNSSSDSLKPSAGEGFCVGFGGSFYRFGGHSFEYLETITGLSFAQSRRSFWVKIKLSCDTAEFTAEGAASLAQRINRPAGKARPFVQLIRNITSKATIVTHHI